MIQFKNPYITSNLYRRDNGAVASGAHGTSSRIEVEKARATTSMLTSDSYSSTGTCTGNRTGAGPSLPSPPNPQEDLSDPLCTLFEPIKVDNADADADVFYLIHAQSGGRLVIDDEIFVLRV